MVIERAGDVLFGGGHGSTEEKRATREVKYDCKNGDQVTYSRFKNSIRVLME
jgi:hypothetical protein